MNPKQSQLNPQHSPLSQRRATLELLGAAVCWGFGFVAQNWALAGGMGFLWVTGLRFLTASLILLPLVLLNPKLKNQLKLNQLILALPAGLFLGTTLVFQTWGLKTTTATNSGFITTLYVILVPLGGFLFFKRRIPTVHIFFTTIALLGTALICQLGSGSQELHINTGDLLTFVCALTATFQILWIEQISQRVSSPLVFNLFQCFWAGLIPGILALFLEPFPLPPWASPASTRAWIALGLLIGGGSIYAFLAQIRAQKILPASVASMLFLLESPFAAAFGWFFLGESLLISQWWGAALILFSALATILWETKAGPLDTVRAQSTLKTTPKLNMKNLTQS